MSRLVQIVGGNGSGKSSVMRRILGEDAKVVGTDLGAYTISEKHRRIVLGKYETACGGCDGIHSTFCVYNLVDRLCREFPDYDICFEGILISAIFSTVARLLMEMRFAQNREVSVNLLWTNPYTTISRVLQRNGGKHVNQDGLVSKLEAVISTFRKHRELGLYRCRAFDTTSMSPEEIAEEILK